MAKSPIETAAAKWMSRINQAQAAGLDLNKIKPLARDDINKVMQGGQGLSDMEANLAMIAGAGGKAIIGDPKPQHTSPLGILGNVGGDIGGIVKGFLPGLVKAAWHLPSETHDAINLLTHGTDKKWLAAHGYDPKGAGLGLSSVGPALRGLAAPHDGRVSLFSLVPGVADAAQLTSGAGREELRRHPVGAALDVLPIAKAAGMAAGEAAAANVAEAGGEVSAGSSLEALQQGKLFKAAARAIPAGRLETGEKASVASKAVETAQKLGLDPESAQNIVKPYSIATRKLRSDAVKFYKGAIQPLVDGMSAEERGQLFDEAAAYHPQGKIVHDNAGNMTIEPISPEHQAILRNVREVQRMMADVGVDRGSLLRVPGPDTRAHVYPVDSVVGKTYERINALSDQMKNARTPEATARLHIRLVEQQKKLVDQMTNELPPATFHDFIGARTKSALGKFVRSKFQGDQVTTALRDIQESTSYQDFAKIVDHLPEGSKNEFQQILQSSMSSWVEMSRMGLDPIWMKHVPESRLGGLLYPKPLPDTYITPSQWKEKVFNFAPHQHDIAVGLTAAGVDVLRADATKQFVDKVIQPLARRAGDIKSELRDSLRPTHPNPDELASHVDNMLHTRFVRFDPAKPFSRETTLTGHDEDLLLPKHMDKTIKGLMDYQNRLPVAGAWDKSLNIFKFSVLTGPRHIVHVAMGGLMFGMLREPGMLAQLPKAFGTVKRGEMPIEIPGSLYDIESDHLFNLAAGKSLAKHLTQAVGDKAKALAHFEETVSNVERTATYLSAAKRGLDHEAALEVAQKTFVDLDNLMPVERLIIKRAFPFYAFTRHLFRYLLTYPADHPIRASILSRFAENEMQEWNTGLPLKYQQLFMLGGGDMKTAVDFKSLNPFRSFSNDFSMVGFAQSLNPLASAGMQAMGINTVNAVPELYPEVEYDPQTGTLQAKRKNFGVALLQSYIPETQVLDTFIGANDRLRQLRQTNPDAYRRALFSALNIPFSWGKVSLSEIKGKAEIARYNAAQRALSSSEKSGNFSSANQFNLVPFRGSLVPPTQLAPVWQQLQDSLRGVSPKAAIPPYRGRTKR